jgi:hypothetical protein
MDELRLLEPIVLPMRGHSFETDFSSERSSVGAGISELRLLEPLGILLSFREKHK